LARLASFARFSGRSSFGRIEKEHADAAHRPSSAVAPPPS
jgi:hypothetical protein